MSRPAPQWNRLKDVAAKRRDVQAQRLSAVARERDDAQRRLDTLVAYRSDYQTRLADASRTGIDLEALRNYQSFLAQLERAIVQQVEILDAAERAVTGATTLWSSERKRVDSFQALDERHQGHVAREEDRRVQKSTDEWAARRSAHAATPDSER